MGEIMKKVIGWVIIIILSVCSFMIVKEKTEIYNIGNENDNAEFKIKYKGLKGAVDFTSINDKIYIAFPHMIKCIENGKEPYTVLNDENLNIECAEPVGESLYFISNSKLMSYDINNKNVKEHIANLPNTGDYKNILLKSYDDKLFITIGAMTNSGVVGDDNTWISENKDNHDLTPETIKVNENSKGAFVKKGEANTSNQTIKASEIGNSSVVIFNTSTGDFETYAWGIRNINGIDITDDGKIYATVGGYEPRGDRPVYNDSDYIYEIKKDHWYGFPDYSGGDSLESPRFNLEGKDKVKMILSEIPMNPPAPYYQYTNVNSLGWIAIDETGKIAKNNKGSIFFYNKENNSIYYSLIGGVFEKFIGLNSDCVATSMKIINNELYILDSGNGFLFTIEGKQ